MTAAGARKPISRGAKIAGWVIAGLFVLVVVIVVSSIVAAASAPPAYKVAVVSTSQMGAQDSVVLKITNTTDAPATPTCTVAVYTTGNTDLGSNTVQFQKFPAHATKNGVVVMDVKPGVVDPSGTVAACN